MPAHRRGTGKSVAAVFLSGTQKLSFHLAQQGKNPTKTLPTQEVHISSAVKNEHAMHIQPCITLHTELLLAPAGNKHFVTSDSNAENSAGSAERGSVRLPPRLPSPVPHPAARAGRAGAGELRTSLRGSGAGPTPRNSRREPRVRRPGGRGAQDQKEGGEL